MNYQILATELALPAYSGLTDQAAADLLNANNIAVDVDTVGGVDIFEATTQADYAALTANQKNLYHAIIAMENIRVKGSNTRAALLAMFGVGTQTRTNLSALQTTMISRATQIGLGFVLPGHVQMVREGRPF